MWMRLCLVVVLLLGASRAGAQSADNVLVVINEKSADSIKVGEYYANARTIAADHVVRIQTSTEESISLDQYLRTIETPIGTWLVKNGLQDRILYIVLTKGVPIRVLGTGGREGTVASVDSELTLIYRKLVGTPTTIIGRLENPYYLGEDPIASAKPFSRIDSDLMLVTRLDGFTVDDAIALVDRARAATSGTGRVVLDQRAHLVDSGGDRWLRVAAERLEADFGPQTVLLEMTRSPAAFDGPVIGYYSWGSNDGNHQRRNAGLQFAPGAIAGWFVSTDARTFREPPKDWAPGPSSRPPSMFGSGSQSVIADLVREGVTGAAAHVDEPYLDGTVRPQILFPAYRHGMNLAEAFYLAMPYVSWENIVLGDPLCAPYRTTVLTASQLHKGIDPETEQPALYTERRIAALAIGGLNVDAMKMVIRASALTSRGEDAEAEALLRKAIQIEPRLTGVALDLATRETNRGNHDGAIEIYRKVLTITPKDPIALNNLAYSLAVYKNSAREALPYARSAFQISQLPIVADTLAWVHHLLGDDYSAKPLIERAANEAPGNLEILVHAAFIHVGVNDRVKANEALTAALKIDPKLADREDVKALKKKIGGE
jgi:uncharacterized protein (TIGR03790 family)